MLKSSPPPAKADLDHNILYIKARLSGLLHPTGKHENSENAESTTGSFFMSDEKCCQRVLARVVSTFNQLIQPRNTFGIVDFFTAASIDTVEVRGTTPSTSSPQTWMV